MKFMKIVISLLILLGIILGGCIYYQPECGNKECESKENAFTCEEDCNGVPSCRIVKYPKNEGPFTTYVGGDYEFALELKNILHPSKQIESVKCGKGAELESGPMVYWTRQWHGNMGFGTIIGTCKNFKNSGLADIAQAKIYDGDTLVHCTGYLITMVNEEPPEEGQKTENLISNPGFENRAADWTIRFDGIEISDNSHSGNNSVRIIQTDHTARRISQRVEVDPNKKYNASGWMKTENINSAGAEISIAWYTSAGRLIANATRLGMLNGTQDWTLYMKTFSIPQNASIAEVNVTAYVEHDGEGTVWADDLNFVPVS